MNVSTTFGIPQNKFVLIVAGRCFLAEHDWSFSQLQDGWARDIPMMYLKMVEDAAEYIRIKRAEYSKAEEIRRARDRLGALRIERSHIKTQLDLARANYEQLHQAYVKTVSDREMVYDMLVSLLAADR